MVIAAIESEIHTDHPVKMQLCRFRSRRQTREWSNNRTIALTLSMVDVSPQELFSIE